MEGKERGKRKGHERGGNLEIYHHFKNRPAVDIVFIAIKPQIYFLIIKLLLYIYFFCQKF